MCNHMEAKATLEYEEDTGLYRATTERPEPGIRRESMGIWQNTG